jgi:hypothetical protein
MCNKFGRVPQVRKRKYSVFVTNIEHGRITENPHRLGIVLLLFEVRKYHLFFFLISGILLYGKTLFDSPLVTYPWYIIFSS